MIVVLHHRNRDPEIFFDCNEKAESKIVSERMAKGAIRRCTAEEWYGQDDPKYAIHHYTEG